MEIHALSMDALGGSLCTWQALHNFTGPVHTTMTLTLKHIALTACWLCTLCLWSFGAISAPQMWMPIGSALMEDIRVLLLLSLLTWLVQHLMYCKLRKRACAAEPCACGVIMHRAHAVLHLLHPRRHIQRCRLYARWLIEWPGTTAWDWLRGAPLKTTSGSIASECCKPVVGVQHIDYDLWDFHESPYAGFVLPSEVAACRTEPGLREQLVRLLDDVHFSEWKDPLETIDEDAPWTEEYVQEDDSDDDQAMLDSA